MATATSPSTHVRKRQYQPSIASYFNRGDATHPQRSSRSPLSPVLPADTQASLLSVGMRVRKSVPEGYKTHKTHGMDGFPFPSTAPSAYTAPARPVYSGGGSSRELTPFCGLHKTGGLAAQETGWMPSSSAPSAVQTGGDAVPALSMSQNTLASSQNTFLFTPPSDVGVSKKRTYEEEIEEDIDAFFDEVDNPATTRKTRVMVKAKASLRRAATAPGIGTVDAGDFDDASFLAPMDVDEL
ncbi:hypothetical protein LTR36_006240 [Oleoguttula mirabilis]|uniref:Uncharacterized protein n=1 Tax=Oleoguttula mirabilis TaxID=1507867 RepID=A0AAV9JC51_9PEZI|nr:hypothetical protein LTR36_006240 [Oleoguttula mirabilis]